MIAFGVGNIVRLADGREVSVKIRRGYRDAVGNVAGEGQIAFSIEDAVAIVGESPVLIRQEHFSGNRIPSSSLELKSVRRENGDVLYFVELSTAGHPMISRIVWSATAFNPERLAEGERELIWSEMETRVHADHHFGIQRDLLRALYAE